MKIEWLDSAVPIKGNPRKKGKRRAASKSRGKRRGARPNPSLPRFLRGGASAAKRSASVAPSRGNAVDLLKAGVAAVLGAVIARHATRAVLKEKDTGFVGPAANVGAGLLLVPVARTVGAGKYAGAVAIGAAAAGMARVLDPVIARITGGQPIALSDYAEVPVPIALSDYAQIPSPIARGGYSGGGQLGAVLETDLVGYVNPDGSITYQQDDGSGMGRIAGCSMWGYSSLDQIYNDPRLSDRSKAIAADRFNASCGY